MRPILNLTPKFIRHKSWPRRGENDFYEIRGSTVTEKGFLKVRLQEYPIEYILAVPEDWEVK